MWIKRLLIGKPLPLSSEKEERLSKFVGLAIFSSDAISSVAYATEEILIALIVAGGFLLHGSLAISLSVVCLMAIVSISYYQTIQLYPSGGGPFSVAKENLGLYPGLVAGAALIMDYVLTIAVNVSCGIAAITSAFPSLYGYRVILGVVIILFIMIVNLRGVRESGKIFCLPTYLFIFGIFLLMAAGLKKYFFHSMPAVAPQPIAESAWNIFSIFILLKAFTAGCSAFTGIEALTNGVKAFRPPESKNAGTTLIWIVFIIGILFLGISFLADTYNILPGKTETVLSQIARQIFHGGFFYYLVQFSTSLILIFAANTSFGSFPRLIASMAREGFLPKRFDFLGSRLVYSNGIIMLGILSSFFLVIFFGYTHALIPLYMVAVFIALTLSQSGMAKYWLTNKGRSWIRKVLINGIGSVLTFIVVLVTTITKFADGAWIVLVAIPILILVSVSMNKHYNKDTA